MPSSDFYKKVYGGMADGTLVMERHGSRQKGSGFFGRIIRGSLAPIIRSVLPYLKDMALEGVGGLVSELKEGKSVAEAGKNQLKRTASTLVEDVAKRVRRRVAPQVGSGIGRKRQAQKQKAKRRTTLKRRPPLFPL